MLRAVAFCVGLISVTAGLVNYDSELAAAPLPIVTGGLVLFLAIFNLIPQFKHCPSCNKKLLKKADTCRFCGAKQPPLDP